MSNPIKLTHIDESIFIINADQIESIIETVEGTMIQIIGKSVSHFTVKESLEEIEDLMLRDQFAMRAMGIIKNDCTSEEFAESAYMLADAMLKARKETAE